MWYRQATWCSQNLLIWFWGTSGHVAIIFLIQGLVWPRPYVTSLCSWGGCWVSGSPASSSQHCSDRCASLWQGSALVEVNPRAHCILREHAQPPPVLDLYPWSHQLMPLLSDSFFLPGLWFRVPPSTRPSIVGALLCQSGLLSRLFYQASALHLEGTAL